MRRWFFVGLVVVAASCTGEPQPLPITQVGTAPAVETPASSTVVSTASTSMTSPFADDRPTERLSMVDDQIEARGIEDSAVLAAMAVVPRHRFVLDDWQDLAYRDHPLPIGYGQTISQPYIVALMTEALDVAAGDRVLEIGTGSGYQAAVLAEMGLDVFTIEIIPELAARAEATLRELDYAVNASTSDGYFGWPEEAPFDGIIVTAAPDHVPQPLLEQLAPGGVMVIPVGPIGAVQTLWRFSVTDDGTVLAESLGPVAFVPFTRDEE